MSQSAGDDDAVLSIDDVHALLYTLDAQRLTKLAGKTSYVGTADGPAKEKPATALRNASIALGDDSGYYLEIESVLLFLFCDCLSLYLAESALKSL